MIFKILCGSCFSLVLCLGVLFGAYVKLQREYAFALSEKENLLFELSVQNDAILQNRIETEVFLQQREKNNLAIEKRFEDLLHEPLEVKENVLDCKELQRRIFALEKELIFARKIVQEFYANF